MWEMVKYKNIFYLLLFISIPFCTSAQWESLGDSIVPQDHIVKSLKIAPDHSIWFISTHSTQLPKIHISTDEGKTWNISKVPFKDSIEGWDISPIDSMTAFIALGSAGLYKTTNGGQSWASIENYPYSCIIVHFFNKTEGWVFSGRQLYAKSSLKNWNVHSVTKDGGESWTHIGGKNWDQPPGTSLPKPIPNEMTGIIGSINASYDYTENAIIMGMSSGNYWLSLDKGYNWSRHQSPLTELGIFTSSVAMKDSKTFMVSGNYNPRKYAITKSYTTLDGGKNWLQGKPEVTASATHYIPESDGTFVMLGISDNSWGGGKGTAITYDYGKNWEIIDNTRLSTLDFIDRNIGFAAYGNFNFYTTTTGQIYKWDFDLPSAPGKPVKSLLWILSISVVVIGFIFHRYRIQQVRKEAQTSLQLSALERSALRAQMNPHFIFNALNSLQSFINNNEVENSNIFLSHFSQLIRGTLKASKEQNVSLEVEIELLKSYLKLEKMRFEDRFDFKISIAEDIDVQAIKVPSMITQPFVENAIIHGLSKKSINGLIELDYKLKEEYLIITIKDNGKGIFHTSKNKNKLHKSMGINNILKRLKLINPENELHMSEQKEDNGKVLGTKITLSILVKSTL
jgi:photosystem II stability/assembly factor-like uncharacterized protein